MELDEKLHFQLTVACSIDDMEGNWLVQDTATKLLETARNIVYFPTVIQPTLLTTAVDAFFC